MRLIIIFPATLRNILQLPLFNLPVKRYNKTNLKTREESKRLRCQPFWIWCVTSRVSQQKAQCSGRHSSFLLLETHPMHYLYSWNAVFLQRDFLKLITIFGVFWVWFSSIHILYLIKMRSHPRTWKSSATVFYVLFCRVQSLYHIVLYKHHNLFNYCLSTAIGCSFTCILTAYSVSSVCKVSYISAGTFFSRYLDNLLLCLEIS